jgi:predicted metal-binding protein
MPPRHSLTICASCCAGADEAQGGRLAEHLSTALDPKAFAVRTVPCLSCCSRPVALAAEAVGKATYVFADVDAEADRAAILTFARLYGAAQDGWIEDARPLGRLRHRLVARIPAG